MKLASIACAVALALCPLTLLADGKHRDGDHHKPKYGGVVREVKEVQYELVARPDSLAIYIEDHGKKIGTQGGSAKVTMLNGSEKTEANLVPAGDNKLEAKGSFQLSKETKVVAVVSLPGKATQSMRFALK